MTAADVDWDALRVEAVRMTTLAYCPYSEFPVGVAGWVDDGPNTLRITDADREWAESGGRL